MKKIRARFLSLLLTVCMVMSLLPMVAFATEGGATIGASSLCEHHRSHTADCYTDELTCGYVQDSGKEAVTDSDTEHVHTQDCYKLDCQFVCEDCNSALDNVVASDIVIAAFHALPDNANWQNYDYGAVESLDDLTLPNILDAKDVGGNDISIENITWESDPDFDPKAAGAYRFSPVFPNGYSLADGVDAPVITVIIEPENTVKAQMLAVASGTMSIHLTSSIPLDADTSGEGWTWTASTATLTLNRYQGQGIILDCGYGETINLVLVGDSSVTANGAHGIYCKGRLKISGSGSLTITATGAYSGYGISAGDYGTLSISGGTVTASSTSKSAFNKAPSELPASYTARWSSAADGTGFTGSNAFIWNADYKYVQIKTVEGEDDIQITAAPISGVITPAVGNAPQTTIPATDQYSASIEWRDPNGTFGGAAFAPETVYRLQVVLSAKKGYTFKGLTADNLKGFTVNGIEPSFTNPVSDTRSVIQVEFPATGTAPSTTPTVSNFTATRTAADEVDFKFTPSTGGTYGFTLQKADEVPPTNIALNTSIGKADEEHLAGGVFQSINANDVLKLYLQIADKNGNRSEVYTLEVPAYVAYDISVTGGMADPATAAEGAFVTLTADDVPNGQQFKEWNISPAVTFLNGSEKNSKTAYFTMPGQAVTAAAVFEDIPATSATGSMSIGTTSVSDLKQDASGTGWTWTAVTATLALEGSYTGESIGIFCAKTDTIQIQYNGDVTARSAYSTSLGCQGNLRISGIGGTLTLTGNPNNSGLSVEGTLEIIQSAAVAASGGMDGIYAKNGLTISGDTDVTAVGSNGMSTFNGDVTIDTTGSVSATGEGEGYAIEVVIGGDATRGQLLVKNGTVTLTQTDTPTNLHTGSLIHTGGTVNGVGVGEVNAATPVITRQPRSTMVKVGESVTLSVAATVSDGGTLSYQWKASSNSELGGSVVSNTATCTSSTAAVGTMYYLCTVTNTNENASGNKTAIISSNQVAVTVQSGGSGGGSSSGGGGSTGGSTTNVTTPPATTENPNPPTKVTTTVNPTVSGDTVSATVPEKAVDTAIAKAQAEAKKNGTAENGIVVEIKVDTKNTKAENINTSLPKASLDALVKAGATEVRITSEIADINLNLDTLKEIQKQIDSDIYVMAKKIDNSTLSAEVKKIVGNCPVYDLSITGKNGKKITDFGNGKVSVSIPYTLGANENAASVIAYYIDSTGKLTEMPNSVYDPVTQTLSFVTDHFSKFAVGYKTVTVNFTDITNHWAKDSIKFVAARGLLNGTGEGKFSPNTSMTRGMLVTALGRLAEIDAAKYTKSSFTDVKADAYYMPSVEWASKNGIVADIGDGKFVPDASITREQMAVIMQNYANAIGFNLPKVHAENSFADSIKISTWAKDVVKSMQMAGVIAGKNGNLFDPQGTATRAEVSAVLKRFVELAISTDSAEGWALNDSGKWMYYENGKAVTGKKDIDGTTYIFDQYGVTADIPQNRKYTTYIVQKGDSFWRIANNIDCTIAELEQLNGKSRFSLIHPGDVLKVPEK